MERSFVGAARGVLAPADSATSLLSYLSGARVELLAPIPVCRYARFKERSRVPLALTRRRRALVRRAKIGRPPRRKPRGKKEEGGDHPAPTHTSTMAVADPEDAEEAVVELDSDSDAAGGTEDETPNDVAGTDDDVPSGGENYFGRAAKEGAAPVGANPFAMPAPSADDDWMREIEEAKRMVEAQRIKREREEAVERQKEIEAAEAKGKVYEERRKAGDSPAPVSGTGGQGGRRERKIVRAKRPTGGGGLWHDADVRGRRRRRRREPVRGVQLRAAARVHARAHGGYTCRGESFQRGVLAAVHSGGRDS